MIKNSFRRPPRAEVAPPKAGGLGTFGGVFTPIRTQGLPSTVFVLAAEEIAFREMLQ